eukprot:3098845-Lingulodinium_polyedra.AAC.1
MGSRRWANSGRLPRAPLLTASGAPRVTRNSPMSWHPRPTPPRGEAKACAMDKPCVRGRH